MDMQRLYVVQTVMRTMIVATVMFLGVLITEEMPCSRTSFFRVQSSILTSRRWRGSEALVSLSKGRPYTYQKILSCLIRPRQPNNGSVTLSRITSHKMNALRLDKDHLIGACQPFRLRIEAVINDNSGFLKQMPQEGSQVYSGHFFSNKALLS